MSANRLIGYFRLYEWRGKAQIMLVCVQDNLNMCILCMFESTFSLDAAHMKKRFLIENNKTKMHSKFLTSGV